MATGWPMKVSYANGDVYSASDVNDTNGTINLLGSSVAYTAGKNKIINGDFRVNQRNFSTTSTSGTFGFDRWAMTGTATTTYSAQTFTPGAAPVAGYEGATFARMLTSGHSGASAAAYLGQKIEDVRTFAGQTITVSFWAKAASGTPKVGINLVQNFGSGGSGEVIAPTGSVTLTTSWVRYTLSVAIPSISGKTIGTSSYLFLLLWTSAGTDYAGYTNIGVQNATIDFWGVQTEIGTATAFQTATGTIPGELAACQRYYFQYVSGTSKAIAIGNYFTATQFDLIMNLPVTMRTSPTIAQTTGTDYYAINQGGGADYINSFTLDLASTTGFRLYNGSEAGGTLGRAGTCLTNNAAASLAFSAEL
jgi:hypothetical protein